MSEIDVSKCCLTHYPKEILSKQTRVTEKIDETIRKLVDKMADIMIEHKGIGLAGPQAGVDLRIFIISLDGGKENLKVFINPTVTPTGELDLIEEGCLSLPGIYTKVHRYQKCKVTATDLDGNEFTEEAEGLYARALQHENDHINGVTIADKMGSAARLVHRKRLKKLFEEYQKTMKE